MTKDVKPSAQGHTPHFLLNWSLFCCVSMMNNLPYVVVLSAAKSIAENFEEQDNYGILGWALTALSFFSQLVCTWMLRKRIPHWQRILGNALLLAAGLTLVATAPTFWVAVAGILLIGAQCTFGEINWLGYMCYFDPLLMSAWGFGTGLAGIGGTGLYLLLHGVAGLSNSAIFGMLIPMAFVYFGAFFLLKPLFKEPIKSSALGEVADYAEQKTATLWTSVRMTMWVGTNLMLVYFFEYMSFSKFGRDATAQSPEMASVSEGRGQLWTMCNGYEILQFLYQVGVLISRTALPLWLKIPFLNSHYGVAWLTAAQFIMMIYWVFAAATQSLSIYLNFVMMFLVGLFGGSMYVLSCYRVQSDNERYPQDQKEMCIVTYHLYVSVGLAAQYLLTLGLDKTVWPPANNEGCIAAYGSG